MGVVFTGEIFADYFQFYLLDVKALAVEPPFWTQLDLERRLFAAPGRLTFCTARNLPVLVEVELHPRAPLFDVNSVDHAVECPFHSSGKVILAGCSDYLPDARRLAIPAGHLKVLLLCHGLGTVSADGLKGRDHYALHLWRDQDTQVIVRKQSTVRPA